MILLNCSSLFRITLGLPDSTAVILGSFSKLIGSKVIRIRCLIIRKRGTRFFGCIQKYLRSHPLNGIINVALAKSCYAYDIAAHKSSASSLIIIERTNIP